MKRHIQWHPDNMIYIRQNGEILYAGTVEEAGQILGEPLIPSETPGVRERVLIDGEDYSVDYTTDSISLERKSWPQGQKLLNKLSDLKKKQQEKLADNAKRADPSFKDQEDAKKRAPAPPQEEPPKKENPARQDMKQRARKLLERMKDPKNAPKVDAHYVREELQGVVAVVQDLLNDLDE